MQLHRNVPKVIQFVVEGDGHDGSMLADHLRGTCDSLWLEAFEIHFDVGWGGIAED